MTRTNSLHQISFLYKSSLPLVNTQESDLNGPLNVHWQTWSCDDIRWWSMHRAVTHFVSSVHCTWAVCEQISTDGEMYCHLTSKLITKLSLTPGLQSRRHQSQIWNRRFAGGICESTNRGTACVIFCTSCLWEITTFRVGLSKGLQKIKCDLGSPMQGITR